MQMFRAKNKVTRDGYDLSKKLCFTAQAGELLPVYSRYVMPGDVFEIQNKWKTRTAPINTAAFTRFREYYDWYFVPMNLLWDKYNTWFTNMTDNSQVATSITGTTQFTDKHPYFTTLQLRYHLLALKNASEQAEHDATYYNSFNQFGFERWKLSAKLLHYLGYGDFYSPESANYAIYNLELSPWRALAYQKIYQDWYRHSQWEVASPQTYNINYISGAEGDLQIPIGDYGISDDTMFDLRYANWNKDLFMGVLPNSQFGDAASIQLSGTTNVTQGATSHAYNIALWSENEGDIVSSSTTNGPTGYNYRVGVEGNPNISYALNSVSVDALRRAMNLSSSANINSAFTILALRQAEALQKWKEITQSNSQDFPSQVEAHYGVRPNNAYSQRSMRLFGTDGTIEIQDIDNTNITENEDGSFNGADIAGKGLAFGSGDSRKFSSDVPGVLMCIYHCVPLLDYALSGVAMDNMKTLFTDYPIPEFDKTGMTQVPLAALTNNPDELDPFLSIQLNPNNDLLGYAPNYIDAKTDIDEVKGAFYNGGLGSWVSPITGNYLQRWFDNVSNTYQWRGLDWRFFKVDPTITNPIFAFESTSDISTDKFWTNCYFAIHAVRPLDAQGLPY